ncbi:MAG: 1-deoxy-D-xylulose-5-phosphate synthase [Alistipes sp.]|nr:1-deoxy-D-xylulose-5-phosphate synthase [Alistipes sp.]
MTHIEYNYLYKVNTPADLRRLSIDELPLYCREVRQYIIEQCAINPGHLASSLGAVEIAVAVHYVYNTPDDKLIWDVGHQAYAHKIITARRDAFTTNRKKGGISGFPRIAESEYDAFGAGHASVSISAALGMVKAAQLRGEQRKVIAVIGDGSMTGGLAFEGLNNAGADKNNDILVILNDNNMAIDHATGALNDYLLRMSTSKTYNRIKQSIWSLFSHIPPLLRFCKKAGNAIKHGLLQNSNLFESFGFRYFGRIDGHDVKQLVRTLTELRDIHSPKLLHIITTKGHGYQPAEQDMPVWHAPGRFNPDTGERIKQPSDKDRYQDVFGQTLLDLAKADSRVVGVTPAMPTGCSMNIMMESLPERCFDVGIAESHAVTFSAGLAAAGQVPFCNIYSTFMQRAYDNIIHDVALQSLPVVLCLDRGGLVGEDGATHHGAFDLAYLSCIPNMTVAAPSDELELRNMMYTALQSGTPFAIRYPRGTGRGTEWRNKPFELQSIGRARLLREGTDVAVLAIGKPCAFALEAAELAEREGISTAVYDLRYAKPLDRDTITKVCSQFRHLITVEDGILRGGVGEAISRIASESGSHCHITTLGIADRFVEQGTPAELYAECGYNTEGILNAITRAKNEKN